MSKTVLCKGCFEQKSRAAFYPSEVTPNRLQPRCMECQHRRHQENIAPMLQEVRSREKAQVGE